MHVQKDLAYLYTKKFLLLLLHFWNKNLSPKGQMIPLIGAQRRPQNTAPEGWMVQSIDDY